ATAFPRQALHAASISFMHPDTEEWMEFEADLPEDMANLLEILHG
ncbi:MAG TPA: RNA pseudouridine synthase, partial [Alphaproteobacteria bacterium]|nr:RNA pseudouridine synthase [Alphaproteobacteria bacterium]